MKTLKGRLISAAAVWIVIGMIAAGILLSSIFRTHVTAQFYDELYVHLDELQRLAEVDASGVRLQRQLSDPRYDVPRSGYYWEIQRQGNALVRSASLQGPLLKTPTDRAEDVGIHRHQIEGPTGRLLVVERAHWTSPSDAPVRYLIGTDERHLDDVFHSFDRTLLQALGALALLLVAASAFLISLALRPLNELKGALAEVRAGNKSRMEGNFPSEVQPLVDELNALFSSTTDLIQRARAQAGNIAHGLKTSLAVLTDEAHRLRSQGRDKAADLILAQCSRMQSHVDYQIARARAVALRDAPGTLAYVSKAAGDIVSALRRLHAARGLQISNDMPDDVMVSTDAQDLNEMLANLVDNACKHATSKVRLSLVNANRADMIVLRVDDDGPGLPPEAFDVVFRIGERWDSQKPGSGLGLTIVRDLARLYGGDVRLDRSDLGGLRADLTLPAVVHNFRTKN
ncbi:MAG: HAMP domain-containing histidine kinase [Hyphomicrobiaceae bacterium]|nr:HAMP domain-containing histidine kinase [Hyphomicrobiaceae bacterium]MCC0011234.1 HAMP domain-containing histidine kinase [Hyphomicrobiaceae bacterium]